MSKTTLKTIERMAQIFADMFGTERGISIFSFLGLAHCYHLEKIEIEGVQDTLDSLNLTEVELFNGYFEEALQGTLEQGVLIRFAVDQRPYELAVFEDCDGGEMLFALLSSPVNVVEINLGHATDRGYAQDN